MTIKLEMVKWGNNYMYKGFAIKDIVEFLDVHGIVWDGNYRSLSEDRIWAEVQLRRKKGDMDAHIVMSIDDITFCCDVTSYANRSSSETIERDFSQDWVKFMVLKYPKKSEGIKKLIEKEIATIHNKANRDVVTLETKIAEIRKNEDAECTYLNQILKTVKKTDSSISQPPATRRM